MTGSIPEVNPDRLAWGLTLFFVYHFVDPNLGVKIFYEREGVTD